MKIKHILIVSVSVLLLAALVASLLLRPKEMSQLGLESQDIAVSGTAQCDAAQGPCEFRAGELGLTLHLVPPVQSLRPFDIHLQVDGVQPRQVVLTFTMADMDMGLNRFVLRPGDGDWRGRAVLPICTQSRNDWLATVTVRGEGRDYRVVFPFTSQ
jgi:hypothetical protein